LARNKTRQCCKLKAFAFDYEKPTMMKNNRILSVFLVILLLAGTANAERKYIFGTSLHIVGGVGNQIGESRFSSNTMGIGNNPFYEVLPSVTLQSNGAHSALKLDYSFVGQRLETDEPITTTSHSFTGTLNTQIGKRVRFNLANSFSSVPTVSVLPALKGIAITPEGFQFVFEPNFYKRTRLGDSAWMSLDVDLTQKSYLTIEGSGSYLRYERDVHSTGYLSDQYREEGSVSFSHRSSDRASWTVKYGMHQNQIKGYPNARSHMITLGPSFKLSPTVRLMAEAGPSYTEKTTLYSSYTGYYASVNLTKEIRERNTVTIYYSHNPGDSTGLGPITDSHQGGAGLSLVLARATMLNFDARAYKQSQREQLILDYWGAEGTAALSQTFGTHWVASAGFSYGIYKGQVLDKDNIAYRQAFVSIGFSFPELWRSMR
jgi:hypothetical protein